MSHDAGAIKNATDVPNAGEHVDGLETQSTGSWLDKINPLDLLKNVSAYQDELLSDLRERDKASGREDSPAVQLARESFELTFVVPYKKVEDLAQSAVDMVDLDTLERIALHPLDALENLGDIGDITETAAKKGKEIFYDPVINAFHCVKDLL